MRAKIVNSGIDGLVIGFDIARYRNTKYFMSLKAAKARAGEKLFGGKGASVNWFGKEFSVSAKGTRGYEWILENADVRIYIAQEAKDGQVYPEVYVTFRANYLWQIGPVRAVQSFKDWLKTWSVVKDDRVSRCDLCIDIEMQLPEINIKEEVVTRAKNKIAYYEEYATCKRNTGYRMGSGPLIARIYDKSLEIKASQKEWFKDIWIDNGWDNESNIVRVEFQARRDFLKKMSVNSFESLCERMADMWRYYTNEWLTIRVPGKDTHRNRWPVSEWWKTIQDGFNLFGKAYGVIPLKKRSLRYEHLMRQVRGVLISATAVACYKVSLEKGYSTVNNDIKDWFESNDFQKDVVERMASLADFSAPIVAE